MLRTKLFTEALLVETEESNPETIHFDTKEEFTGITGWGRIKTNVSRFRDVIPLPVAMSLALRPGFWSEAVLNVEGFDLFGEKTADGLVPCQCDRFFI